ncbi:MAG: hypothetical protein ACK56C_00585 [Alphaproteobacteria bacterium]
MTRTLLLAAAAICLIPAVASAQAVPPSRFVGPPASLAGSDPPLARNAPPKDERVGPAMAGAGLGAGLASNGATIVDSRATRAGENAAALNEARDVDLMTGNGSVMDSPLADPHGKAIQGAGAVSDVAKGVGAAAGVVQMGASAYAAADKCTGAKVNGSDCAQAGLSAVSGAVGAADGVAMGKAPAALGRVAGGAQLAADVVAVHKNCISDKSNVGECVLSSFDATMSATALAPGGQAVAAGYSIAKTVLPAAVDAGFTYATGKSPGAWVYDKTHQGEDAEMMAKAGSPEALEAIRARRTAAYIKAQGGLNSKQADYDAQQAEIQRQQIAAQEAAQSQAQSQAMMQNFVGNLQAMSQPRAPVSTAPSSTGCHPGHDEAAHPGGCLQGNGTAR